MGDFKDEIVELVKTMKTRREEGKTTKKTRKRRKITSRFDGEFKRLAWFLNYKRKGADWCAHV